VELWITHFVGVELAGNLQAERAPLAGGAVNFDATAHHVR
jgi:hypothetical protein